MQRRLEQICETTFDLLVVGAGIHGGCIAREAALCGLSVAVVDRGDFGGATSANSQKIIHGGLRYLQKLDLRRVRQSVRERARLMRMAPHLIAPLPFVIPTYGFGGRGAMALRTAFALCDLIAPGDPVPPGGSASDYAKRLLTRRELRALFPELSDDRSVTGGAMWYDGQVYNSERLTLAFLQSAVRSGTVAANYVEVDRLRVEAGRVRGAVCRDVLGGGEFDIRAGFVVRAAGPWIGEPFMQGSPGGRSGSIPLAKGWNIITRSLHPSHALGVMIGHDGGASTGGRRMIFQTPWRDRTIIGTFYERAERTADTALTPDEIAGAARETSRAFPWLTITPGDVLFHHVGLLPLTLGRRLGVAAADQLSDRPLIVEHDREGGPSGVISVCGVKYTTARLVAQHVVRLVSRRMGRRIPVERGLRDAAVEGGDLVSVSELEARLAGQMPAATEPVIARLARHYGTNADRIISLFAEEPDHALPVAPGAHATRAEVRYAVRHEMAVKLSDAVLRRTGLGSAGHPGEPAIRGCADVMAAELGWTTQRSEKEVDEVRRAYGTGGGSGPGYDVNHLVAAPCAQSASGGNPRGAQGL